MKVYVVTCEEGGWCDSFKSVDAVFLEKDKAEEYMVNESNKFKYCEYYYDEYEVTE